MVKFNKSQIEFLCEFMKSCDIDDVPVKLKDLQEKAVAKGNKKSPPTEELRCEELNKDETRCKGFKAKDSNICNIHLGKLKKSKTKKPNPTESPEQQEQEPEPENFSEGNEEQPQQPAEVSSAPPKKVKKRKINTNVETVYAELDDIIKQ